MNRPPFGTRSPTICAILSFPLAVLGTNWKLSFFPKSSHIWSYVYYQLIFFSFSSILCRARQRDTLLAGALEMPWSPHWSTPIVTTPLIHSNGDHPTDTPNYSTPLFHFICDHPTNPPTDLYLWWSPIDLLHWFTPRTDLPTDSSLWSTPLTEIRLSGLLQWWSNHRSIPLTHPTDDHLTDPAGQLIHPTDDHPTDPPHGWPPSVTHPTDSPHWPSPWSID